MRRKTFVTEFSKAENRAIEALRRDSRINVCRISARTERGEAYQLAALERDADDGNVIHDRRQPYSLGPVFLLFDNGKNPAAKLAVRYSEVEALEVETLR